MNINDFLKSIDYDWEKKNSFEEEGSYTYELIPDGSVVSQQQCDLALSQSKKNRYLPNKDSYVFFLLSAAAHILLLFSTAVFMPKLDASSEDTFSQEQVASLLQTFTAIAEKEQELQKVTEHATKTTENSSNVSGENKDVKSATSTSTSTFSSFPRGTQGGSQNREDVLRQAANFGMIEILSSMNASSAPVMEWGKETPPDHGTLGFWGSDSIGEGNLSLSGIGEGSSLGDKGMIGVGRIGTMSDNFGFISKKAPRQHETKGPIMRAGVTTVTGAGLPAELVQRTVRQNFGRFRACYESGLRANPTLAGRVTVRFVIGREGAVISSNNGGSDLPSNEVVSCVTRAFYGLSFAPPNSGIVTVIYPIMFTSSN